MFRRIIPQQNGLFKKQNKTGSCEEADLEVNGSWSREMGWVIYEHISLNWYLKCSKIIFKARHTNQCSYFSLFPKFIEITTLLCGNTMLQSHYIQDIYYFLFINYFLLIFANTLPRPHVLSRKRVTRCITISFVCANSSWLFLAHFILEDLSNG